MKKQHDWMGKHPLGSLVSSTPGLNRLDHPASEAKNTLSQKRNTLFEDKRSGLIDANELQTELKKLRLEEEELLIQEAEDALVAMKLTKESTDE